MPETGEACFDQWLAIVWRMDKRFFKRVVMMVKVLKKAQEVEQVCGMECAVLKGKHAFQIGFFVVIHELVRCSIHQMDQLLAFGENRFPLPPGKNCCKQPHDFDVLFPGKLMRNADGVIFNEIRMVIEIVLFVKQGLYIQLLETPFCLQPLTLMINSL